MSQSTKYRFIYKYLVRNPRTNKEVCFGIKNFGADLSDLVKTKNLRIVTKCLALDEQNNVLAEGECVFNPKDKRFVKVVGRTISFGRCSKKLGIVI